MDLWADFIEPSGIANTNCRVLIVPWHPIGKKETCERLQQYVEGGGTLILETGFGLFDERCFYNPVVPPWGLAEVFGYREKESYYLLSKGEPGPLADLLGPAVRPAAEQIYYEPEIEFSLPIRTRAKARTLLTPINVTSATPIATYQNLTVGAMKKVGKGNVYYVGTNLGASIAAGNDAGIDLLRAIVTQLARPSVSSSKIRPRLIEGSNRGLLVAFNDTAADQTENIALPSRYHRATDIHSRSEQRLENSSVRVTVPYQDAVVLLLE
jgi:hypothetical protein